MEELQSSIDRKVLELCRDYGITSQDLPHLKRFEFLKGGDGTLSSFLHADANTRSLFIQEYRKWRRGEQVFLLREL
jgi:hypothetical protein